MSKWFTLLEGLQKSLEPMTPKLPTKYSLPPDAFLARHAIFRKDCVTSQKSVCKGD